jgi:uncharacterized repeat protein (TIGR01451 family)
VTKTGIRRLLLLSGTTAMASFGMTGTANAQAAAGTTIAGTEISNQANASYTVNGAAATAQSNVSTFVVDRKVNLTVVADPNVNTQVNLGQTNAVLAFRVTNNTNGIQDMLLRADQNVGLGGTGTDNYDVTNIRVFVDANNDGIYQIGTDTATFIDELGIDASRIVFIVADVPNTASANFAALSLNATVAVGGVAGPTAGAALVPTLLNLINQNGEVDIVFADGDSDGLLGADIIRNGQGRAYLQYEVGVRAVNLTIAKTSTVISDPLNLLVNPRAIPGATVRYCLTVTNSTLLTPATGINLTDVVPANTTYVPGSIRVGSLGLLGACILAGFTVNDDGTPVALSPYGGSYNTTDRTVTAIVPTLLGGTSVAASFDVVIN